MLRLYNDGKRVNKGSEAPSKPKIKQNPAEIRIRKELSEIDFPNVQIIFENPSDIMRFTVRIRVVDENSLWFGASYDFLFRIRESYPFDAPSVVLLTKVYHPHMDYQGNISSYILRSGWRPLFTLYHAIFELNNLFIFWNYIECLNRDAGELMKDDYEKFTRNVRLSLQGNSVDGEDFPKLIDD